MTDTELVRVIKIIKWLNSLKSALSFNVQQAADEMEGGQRRATAPFSGAIVGQIDSEIEALHAMEWDLTVDANAYRVNLFDLSQPNTFDEALNVWTKYLDAMNASYDRGAQAKDRLREAIKTAQAVDQALGVFEEDAKPMFFMPIAGPMLEQFALDVETIYRPKIGGEMVGLLGEKIDQLDNKLYSLRAELENLQENIATARATHQRPAPADMDVAPEGEATDGGEIEHVAPIEDARSGGVESATLDGGAEDPSDAGATEPEAAPEQEADAPADMDVAPEGEATDGGEIEHVAPIQDERSGGVETATLDGGGDETSEGRSGGYGEAHEASDAGATEPEAAPEQEAEAAPEQEAEAPPEQEAEAPPEQEAEAAPEQEAEAPPEQEAEAPPEQEAEAPPEQEAEAAPEPEPAPAAAPEGDGESE